MINWPEDLINDFVQQRAIIFVGSGVSRNSVGKDKVTRPKGWHDFLADAAKKLGIEHEVQPYLDYRDYLTALDLVRSRLTRTDYAKLVSAEYLDPEYSDADIHAHIYRIGANVVLSPNFDKIYDIYAQHKSRGTVLVKQYFDRDIARFVRGDQRVVIKIHGSIDSPEQMIFGRKDYAESRVNHAWFYDILRALIITHTFLFVGCGTDDPDIRMLLEDIHFAAGLAREHYFVAAIDSIPEGLERIMYETMNLRVLKYDFDPVVRDHLDLTKSLEQLAETVEVNRFVPPSP